MNKLVLRINAAERLLFRAGRSLDDRPWMAYGRIARLAIIIPPRAWGNKGRCIPSRAGHAV